MEEQQEDDGEVEGEDAGSKDEPYHAFNRRFGALIPVLEALEDDCLRSFK